MTRKQTVYEYFAELSAIPRGSGNESAASDYLAAFGRRLGLTVVQDDIFNALIRKPASQGRENEPPVILQAHIDMVCEKNAGVNHDFLRDPIVPVTDGDWIVAEKETTLGADNGGGIACIMAILAASDISHPPIEAFFTVNEEAGMTGAEEFDYALLSGRRLINIDTETEGALTVSCAAAADVDLVFDCGLAPVPDGLSAYRLAVSGLAGGHSGMDINKGLANANALMGELLKRLYTAFDDGKLDICCINGGSKRNAIPRECAAVILFDEKRFELAEAVIRSAESEFKSNCHNADINASITIEKAQTPKYVLDGSAIITSMIVNTPNGVISMSPDIDGLVQTSNNLGVVTTDMEVGIVTLSNFPRSSVATEQADTVGKLKSLIGGAASASVHVCNEKPAWQYRPDSPLRDRMASVFMDMYGNTPKIVAVHAGLECGIFARKLPGADLISIGPDIEGAHSPGERMSKSSLNRVYEYLVKVLEAL